VPTFKETRAQVYDLNSTAYQRAQLASSYFRDEGLLVIPVMGPAGTMPSVIRVHAPYGTRTSDFDYVREGHPPLIPAQADTNSGDVILTSEISFPVPQERGSKLIFGAKGSYTFVQATTLRGPDDPYEFDRYPFPSLVDALGQLNPNAQLGEGQGGYNAYNTSIIDTRYLSSYGILG
jgi:hypothetical protein